MTRDARGWRKGRARRYGPEVTPRVLTVGTELAHDDAAYFRGASAVLQVYRQRYPHVPVPSLRFIGRTMRQHGLTSTHQPRQKGAARYLCYPAKTLAALGRSTLEIDFIGRKYIRGRTQPVCFIAFSLRGARILKYFKRIEAESADQAIPACQEFFRRFEVPEVAKVDNGFGFAASSRWPRTVGPMVRFLLQTRITPVFTAPRRPWNQASVEGANSVFGRKFWRRFTFRSLPEIDRRLSEFNVAYQAFTGYTKPRLLKRPKRFAPVLYYIRKVGEHPRTRSGVVELANECIRVPAPYINLFVLARWNLRRHRLTILLERENRLQTIHTRPFHLHQMSRWRLSHFI